MHTVTLVGLDRFHVCVCVCVCVCVVNSSPKKGFPSHKVFSMSVCGCVCVVCVYARVLCVYVCVCVVCV